MGETRGGGGGDCCRGVGVGVVTLGGAGYLPGLHSDQSWGLLGQVFPGVVAGVKGSIGAPDHGHLGRGRLLL